MNAARRIGTTLVVAPGAASAASAAAAPSSAPPSAGTGLFGQVLSALDGRPVAGATVGIPDHGLQTTSGTDGQFTLAAPAGRYLVRVSANGFVAAIQPDQTVREGYTSLNVDLVPFATSEAEQEAIYAKVVRQTESPLVDIAPQPLKSLNGNFSLPPNITVRYDTGDVSVPLEDYVKGVVPNEVPASWPMETLKAQAVAARSYGVASFLARGYVYPDTRSQVYDPNSRTSTTDTAVDATASQVLTYAGAVITAFFFSRCNGFSTVNSEDAIDTRQYTCGSLHWNYVGYCRARQCTGHDPSTATNCGYFGHGVGMCQWGSFYRGTSGTSYDAILASYYTSTTLQNAGIGTPNPLGPFLVQANQPFTLNWASAGSGASYNVGLLASGSSFPEVVYPNGTGTGTGTSCVVGPHGTGTYTWTVTATLNNQQTSARATLQVVDHLRRVYLPVARK